MRDAAIRGLRSNAGGSRARYADDPQAYFSDIFGCWLTPQQEEALALIHSSTRLLLPAGNNTGKTYLLAGYGVFVLDAVAAVIDEKTGAEQGARVLLPGPDAATVFATIYSQMLVLATDAERRGYQMPGSRSERSVNWQVRPHWGVEGFNPPRKIGQEVAHSASGRHASVQIALIEEGQGTGEPLWAATEGMCSGPGNKIISSFNPTEASGPAFQRARGAYRVLHLDAFDHPNVKQRKIIIPGIDFKVIDDRVRDPSQCQDRGDYPRVTADVSHGDFLYALADRDEPEIGPREDGVRGHPKAEVRVYRPSGRFQAQVRGQWPLGARTGGPISPGAWDAAVQRWKARKPPAGMPARIGVDCAREGADDSTFIPRWGGEANTILRAWAEANEAKTTEERQRLIESMQGEAQRLYAGHAMIAPKGSGDEVARYVLSHYPSSFAWNVDEGGVGASVLDHARSVLGVRTFGVSFAATPPDRLPGEIWCENTRAAMYVRLGMLLDRGLIDLPDDPLMREEALAHNFVWSERVIEVVRANVPVKERMDVVRLTLKEEIRKTIGRSPDRADALALAAWHGGAERKPGGAKRMPFGL